jgi:CTP:molybdopterin cytidylyltransferase MocA
MRALKPLLPLGDTRVIEQVISGFQAAGISDIRVVVGHRAAELIPVLKTAGVGWVLNDNFAEGMFSSIKAGVAALPSRADAFFVLPADIPLVRPPTIAALIQAWFDCPADLLYPTFQEQRGHPPLITAAWADRIQTYAGTDGLRGFLRTAESGAREVAVADAGILFDMDTPEDYQQAQHRMQTADIPTPAECHALLKLRFGDQAPVIAHCRTVARIAGAIAEALARAGCAVDRSLVEAAALVHDVAKGTPDHAGAGADLLTDLGFPGVGAVVREHMDLTATCKGQLTETEIVFVADKLVKGDRPVDLNERFADKLDRYGDDPAARAAITRRRGQTFAVRDRIESRLGYPMQDVFAQWER